MLKRVASLLIITSMILHCASRLGILSYCYENLHDILFAVGMIKEKPIAFCDSNYFAEKILARDLGDKNHHQPIFLTAQEIILSAPSDYFSLPDNTSTINSKPFTAYLSAYSGATASDIFHPPSI